MVKLRLSVQAPKAIVELIAWLFLIAQHGADRYNVGVQKKNGTLVQHAGLCFNAMRIHYFFSYKSFLSTTFTNVPFFNVLLTAS